MVAAGDHRRGGAAPERREGRGKRNGGPRLTPGRRRQRKRRPKRREAAARLGSTGTAAFRRSAGETGGVDEVGEVAAEPKEATPKRERVRGDDGGGPELGGDGGERERRRELDSDGERERRVAETVEGGTGSV
uniref:Pr1-like protein n=1 Tax=Oryza sativa subsp. japonica TaxID=39947 RepID=Q69KQ1_ORYSJ|nr:pr1-like protein [Oryza sativa Japonica Group]